MARIPLLCPLDETNLGAANTSIAAAVKGTVISTDPHAHITFAFTLTCQNGHVWSANADVILERVS